MRECPCHNCEHRKPTCHDFCKDYIEWHDEKVVMSKARAFDHLMDIIADAIIWNNCKERRDRR